MTVDHLWYLASTQSPEQLAGWWLLLVAAVALSGIWGAVRREPWL